jgi:PAS domain S-box-containing protein
MQLADGANGRRKIASTFVVVGCLLVVSVGIVYVVGLRALKLNRNLAKQSEEVRQLERFVSTLKDAETGQRGYVLTGEEGYLEPYVAAREKVNQELSGLKRLGSAGDLAAGQVERVAELTEKKLAELEETVRRRRERGLDAALEVVRSGRGKQLMDEIRVVVGKMEAGEQAEFDESNRRAADANVLRTATFILTALVNLAFLGWAYGRLRGEIAQREAAVSESQQEKELLATTLASIGDGVIVTDAQGRIRSLNGEAERITGWQLSEARGKELPDVFNIVNERTGQRQENPIEEVLRFGKVVGLANHTLLVRRDGSKVPIGDSGAPVRKGDGVVEGAVLVFRDVSQEREAQAAKERLAAIVESSDDAIVSKTLEGRIVTWNSGAVRIFGYAAAEIVGQSITLLIPPERIDEEAFVLQQLRRGERVDHFETQRVTKDGRRLDVSLTVSPLKDEEGRVVGASKVLRDVTARKKAEKELVEARKQLEHYAQGLETAVTERTKELRDTVGELEAFCYSLSHDMRTPLRAIQSYSQMVLEEEGKNIGPDCTSYLRKAISAAQRMDQLIRDVLAFTRLSRQEILLEPLDVDRLVHEIVRERPELQPSNAEILIESPLRGVRGHAASLTQCVTNLLDNAVKFVAPGVKPRVRVYSESHNGKIRLCFEDNGIGIEKEAQKKLFGMFQRMHRGELYSGTGIGLAIVRKAAERMHGEVGLSSEAGHGSNFWVELPGVRS